MAEEVPKLEDRVGLQVCSCTSPTLTRPLSIAVDELQVPAWQCSAAGRGLLQFKDSDWRGWELPTARFADTRWLWSLYPAPSLWNSPNVTDLSRRDVKNYLYATALEEAWWHGVWSWVEEAVFCRLIHWLVGLICFVVQEDHYVARCLFPLDCESS